MEIQQAAEIARELNPKPGPAVIDRGDWPPFGKLYNIVFPSGEQTSITVGPFEDYRSKIQDAIQRFSK